MRGARKWRTYSTTLTSFTPFSNKNLDNFLFCRAPKFRASPFLCTGLRPLVVQGQEVGPYKVNRLQPFRNIFAQIQIRLAHLQGAVGARAIASIFIGRAKSDATPWPRKLRIDQIKVAENLVPRPRKSSYCTTISLIIYITFYDTCP